LGGETLDAWFDTQRWELISRFLRLGAPWKPLSSPSPETLYRADASNLLRSSCSAHKYPCPLSFALIFGGLSLAKRLLILQSFRSLQYPSAHIYVAQPVPVPVPFTQQPSESPFRTHSQHHPNSHPDPSIRDVFHDPHPHKGAAATGSVYYRSAGTKLPVFLPNSLRIRPVGGAKNIKG
jgi:hypothetical protein